MDTASARPVADRAAYRITVQGVLDDRWADWLGGMRVVHMVDAEGAALTVLEGEVADQSALVGVFNVLHTMSLPVMAVERRGWDNSGQPTKNL